MSLSLYRPFEFFFKFGIDNLILSADLRVRGITHMMINIS